MRSLLVTLAILAASSRPSDACSPPQCWPGAFVPKDGATIPANAPGFYFRPSESGSPGDASLVRLSAASDPTASIPFTAVPQPNGDFVLVPDAPLVEGETYTLEDRALCNNSTLHSTFTAGPAAPLPTSLGTVELVGHGNFAELDLATVSGSCSTSVDATVLQIALAESASASPWKDLFLYETLVDDQPWVNQASIAVRTTPGESWVGRGKDLLYRVCQLSSDAYYQGLPIGGHEVRFRASLPGASPTTASLATPKQAFEIMCTPDPDENEPDDHDDGGGCSTSTPATLGGVMLVLASLTLRRRRCPDPRSREP
jgi:uncharacterized protein (TIGR03382 family)